MTEKTTIVVQTQFEGMHCYPDAPDEVSYLRYLHRHIFCVKLELEVKHDDRELEFIIVKRKLEDYISSESFVKSVSCEQMAKLICRYMFTLYGERNAKCCVYEDNENGGCVYYEF